VAPYVKCATSISSIQWLTPFARDEKYPGHTIF
jgi:hypothetical protein